MGMPRCKHGWMSSCLEGCEDAYKPNSERCPHCDGTGRAPEGVRFESNGYVQSTECGFCDRGVKKRPDWMKGKRQ